MKRLGILGRTAPVVALIAVCLTGASKKHQYSPRELAFYTDATTVDFVRPGLVFKITGAQIASDGTITATISITDPEGLGLDRSGVTTPGAVSISMIAATIPKGQEQYVAYTTRIQKSPITGVSAIQGSADSGGTFTQVSDGVYKYTFATKAPSGFDATATHTIGAYGSRNLTLFQLGTSYASTTFNFVPNGSTVQVTRDVVRTSGCNNCHDQLSAHGGSRRGVEMCVLCHNPQSVDPDTGNTVDLKVMVHKIHMGSSLPSVMAGKPYQIIGFNQGVSDWSTVVYPADVRRCETCHQQNVKAAQATAHLVKPTRDACGSCHDDVNFATGVNHVAGPQFDDNLCANCHIPQGEIDFDASIMGAHRVPADSSLTPSLVANISSVSNGTAGNKPVVTFTIKDQNGSPVPISTFDASGAFRLTMAGPTSDYGYTSFGSDVKTPGYVTESPSAATTTCASDGTCTFTFAHAVPKGSTGTYAIGVEAELTAVLLPGTTKEVSVDYHPLNKVAYFSVDGSPVQARRDVVKIASCNQCHVKLEAHGGLRNQTEFCVLCHNPSNTDASVRPNAQVAADKTAPPQSVNFNLMVHRIHTGENLLADNRPYVIVGFGGSHNDFSDIRYPALSPTGAAGDTRNCSLCHVNGSEQNLPTGLNAVVDPQGPINPIQPVASACTGCHVKITTASHTLSNTTALGESCTVCHSSAAAFSVGQVHAQY